MSYGLLMDVEGGKVIVFICLPIGEVTGLQWSHTHGHKNGPSSTQQVTKQMDINVRNGLFEMTVGLESVRGK